MTNATFHNFDTKPFTGYWDGKPKTFAPGARVYMTSSLAEHFAKHLANRYLIEHGQEVYTSPKNPGQVPQFMDVFKRAFIADTVIENAAEVDTSPELSMNIEVKKPTVIEQGPAAALAQETAGQGEGAQIISPPAGDDDDESGFDHKA